MKIQVDNRLKVPLAMLPKDVAAEMRELFEHSNPQYFKTLAMGYRPKESPTIRTWKHFEDSESGTWLSLPRGGTERLRTVFDAHDLDYEFVDLMTYGSIKAVGGEYTGDWVTPQVFPDGKLKLWDHQERVVEAILKKKQCVVRAPTGSGKTSALIEAIRRANVPAIVILWETGLLEQWQKRIRDELGVPIKKQGLIQGSKFRLAPITLAMQQTLNRWDTTKWSRLDGVFGFVGGDEVQRYAAATYGNTIDQFNSKYRVGVSADETRRDQKEFLIYDHFGQVALEISKSELEGKGIIHEVGVEAIPTDFAAEWYSDEAGDRDFNKLLTQICDDEERNERIASIAKRRHEKGETILLFTHRIQHCHTLRAMLARKGIAAEFMLGGKENQAEFVRTVERMRDLNDPLRVAIGTLGKVGVGLDIPNLTCGIATTPIHNNRQFMDQVKGRICRKDDPSGKTHADLIYFWDRQVFGRHPLLNFKRWNKHVRVLHVARWVDVNTYLKEHYEEEKRQTSQHFGPFASAESVRK